MLRTLIDGFEVGGTTGGALAFGDLEDCIEEAVGEGLSEDSV